MSSPPSYSAYVQRAKISICSFVFPGVTLNMGGKEVQGYFCARLIIVFVSS